MLGFRSNVSLHDNDGFHVDIDSEPRRPSEEITNKIENAESEETPATRPTENDLSTLHIDGSNDAADHSSRESIPSPMVSQYSS